MSRWLKYSWYAALAAVASGCAGSCSSCSSCGVTPLEGGFENAKRIDNAASVRLTDTGLDFLESNIGPLAGALLGDSGGTGGVITFEVPSSTTTVASVFNVDICAGGPDAAANPPRCVFEADLTRANLNIATQNPHHIVVTGTIAARLQELPLNISVIGGSTIKLNGDASCSSSNFANLPLNVRISIETETDPAREARRGYSRVSIEQFDIDQDALGDAIVGCGGITGAILNALKDTLLPQFIGPLVGNLTGTIEDQLCMSADPAAGVSCPTGTAADADGVCRFSNGDCVGTALGLDGNIDLSGLLASISPGTEGGLDFMLAAGGEGTRDDGSGMLWGDLNAIGGGATLGMMGGAEPRPLTTCVPIAGTTLPTGIPIPDELTANTVSNWSGPGPHLGIALSERFINHALTGAYNSGALCLGIGGEVLGGLLTSDTLGLLVSSLKDISRQQKTAPLALVLRPQAPPSAVVGNGTSLETDPVLRISLPQLIIDFYLWSNDRYVRAFSAQFDLDVPVNLDVDENSALAPVLADVGVANPSMFNAPLIREDKAVAAATLSSLLASQIGGALGGAIDPINLNESLADLGIELRIPETVEGQGSPGLRRLSKGSDNFLGIFAALEVASATYVNASETDVRLVSKTIDTAGLRLDTATPDNVPSFEVQAKSSLDRGEQAVEYQYRLNEGYWRPWQTSSTLVVSDPSLRLQGRHQVEVRSRVVGAPKTVDRTPPTLEVLIDKSLPEIDLGKQPEDGKLTVSVYDVVSPNTALNIRWKLDDGAFTEWSIADGLESIEVGEAASITVEVEDEEGNIASQSQSLIRGRPDAALAGEGACDCSVPGAAAGSGRTPVGLAALGGMLLFMGMRRRRRSPRAALKAQPLASTRNPGGAATARAVRASEPSSATRRMHRLAKVSLIAVAASFNGCSCSDAESAGGTGGTGGTGATGGTGGGPPTCTDCETLAPGLVGAYASAAVGSDGTVWVAAYNDIGLSTVPGSGTNPVLFGDLAVGRVTDGEVGWEAVDGLPEIDPNLDPGTPGGPPDPRFVDTNSYRGGLTDSGDDIGLWTSIQVGGDGFPMVAYYDATNRALKFARRDDQGAWSFHTVQQKAQSDIGRYAKLVLRDGRPAIAFLAIESLGGGLTQSVVRVASAGSALPQGAGDWTFADAAIAPAPCRPYNCASGEECRLGNGVCAAPLTTCDPACEKGFACFDDGAGAACSEVLDKKFTDTFPEASGLYIDAAVTPTGLGLIYYDRIHGNLYAVKEDGGTWQTPQLLDGEAAGPTDTGDTGIGASLFVDGNGDWHVSYADGITESVKYMRVTGGTTPEPAQIVDDGSTDDGSAVVGDDSSVWVNGSGTIFVSYQDSTNGLLKLATNDGTGWQVRALAVDGWVNGFTQLVDVSGSPQVMAHWRKADPHTIGSVVFVTP